MRSGEKWLCKNDIADLLSNRAIYRAIFLCGQNDTITKTALAMVFNFYRNDGLALISCHLNCQNSTRLVKYEIKKINEQ